MDLTAEAYDDAVEAVAAAVAGAEAVAPTGARTQWEVGGPPPDGVAIGAPAGIVAYDPAELTVTVGAGTSCGDLADRLGAAGQEVVLDPADAAATVGGVLATGLSGPRRLRHGPLRDRVLEVRFVTGDARVVKGGGPTVKNVTGYDLPRLLVGSLGTLGVIVRATLRCQPRPETSWWTVSTDPPDAVRARCFRPATVAWDGTTTRVLLEGHADDVAVEARAAGLETAAPPERPAGPHRGRISVRPGTVAALGAALGGLDGVTWLAEVGVGTVHVAASSEPGLAASRALAHDHGGWLLREAGAPGLDGFGRPLPDPMVTARIKAAFDPAGKLAPGRLPIPAAATHDPVGAS